MFASIIRERRTGLGLSQVALSHLSGVSLPTIQNIELGKANPSHSTLEGLCRTLNIEIHFRPVPADLNILIRCGLPLSPSISQKKSRNLTERSFADELFKLCLDLRSKETKDPRVVEAAQALLLAIRSHYPTWFKANLASAPAVTILIPKRPTGRILKLSRQCLEPLSRLL